jgi:hypothetical protein
MYLLTGPTVNSWSLTGRLPTSPETIQGPAKLHVRWRQEEEEEEEERVSSKI